MCNIEIRNLALILLLNCVSLCLDSIYKIACRLQTMGTREWEREGREWKRQSVPVCCLKLFTCFLLKVKLLTCIRRRTSRRNASGCIHTLCVSGKHSLQPVAGVSYSYSVMSQVTALNLSFINCKGSLKPYKWSSNSFSK